MNHLELQNRLIGLGYDLIADGKFGPKSRAALLQSFTDGRDTKLTEKDVSDAADSLGVNNAKIWTVWDVEAAAKPFVDGLPVVLYEPHIFSRLTKHKYDESYPTLSSRAWNRKLYAGSQKGRWDQIMRATSLDVDAGLSAASYGGFQILGANYKVCGYPTPFDFVHAQSDSERMQLLAFVDFVKGNKLDKHLQAGNWAAFAKGYNGPAYAANKYDQKLAAAYAKRSK